MSVEETHPDTERAQADALRRMSGARRVQILASLTSAMIRLSRRAIRRANPGASEQELKHLFIEANYGRELAGRVRAKLRR